MRWRIIVLVVVTTFLSLVVAACKKNEQDTTHNHKHEASIILKANISPREDDIHYEALQRFAQEVESASNGEMVVKINYSDRTDDGEEPLESISKKLNQVDIILQAVEDFIRYEPKVDIMKLPFAFRDYGEAKEFMEGNLQAEAEGGLTGSNMRVIAHYSGGFHYLITKNKTINTARDMQGLLFATSQEKMSEVAMKAVGAQTMSVSAGQIREQLRQGNLVGYEGTLDDIFNRKLYQEANTLVVTNHTYSALLLIIAESTWENLNQEQKQIVSDAAAMSANYDYELKNQKDSDILVRMESAGVRIHRPDLHSFWQKAESVVRSYNSVYGNLADKLAIWKTEKR